MTKGNEQIHRFYDPGPLIMQLCVSTISNQRSNAEFCLVIKKEYFSTLHNTLEFKFGTLIQIHVIIY